MINFSKTDNFFQLETNLLINEDIETVFKFFETPKNLNLITPSWLNFTIVPPIPNNTFENQEIEYKLTLHKIRFTWRSRIIEYKKNVSFCDKQIKGPYLLWEHYHLFSKKNNKTLMTDKVNYKVLFGEITNRILVKRDLKKIFEYRRKKIKEIFIK